MRGRRRIDSSSIIAHPVNFETSLKCDAKNSTYICIYIYDLSIIDIDFVYQFNLKLIAPLFTFFYLKKKKCFLKFQKLTGLWLAGVVVNHVGIYGSKVAEGLSAFQRRSCFPSCWGMRLLNGCYYEKLGLGDFEAEATMIWPPLYIRHFRQFLKENCCVFIQISLNLFPFSNKPTLVQVMAWGQKGDKPSFEWRMVWFAEEYMHLTLYMLNFSEGT